MKFQAPVLVKNRLRATQIGFMFAAVLTFGTYIEAAPTTSWSGTSTISPALQPDPTRGSQVNDVAVNANGDTLSAWDQYNFYAPVSASVGIAIQTGGRWNAPCTFSGTAINADPNGVDIPCAPTNSGTTGFSMTPKVAVGANGTMAVSWTYQDAVQPVQKVQVAVKAASAAGWRGYTLASFTPGGVAITRSVPVAVDASGNVTAAWSEWDGTRNVVKSASLPAGSNTWSATSTLSDPSHDGLYFSLAVNARGDAGVVYSLSPYTTYSTGTSAHYVFRSGPMGFWSYSPVQVSETIMSWVGYVTNPQVALDANGLATVIYMGNSLEATRELPNGSWTPYAPVIRTDISGASYMSPDLAVDNNGNAVVALSIFDPTVGVDRASVWVTQCCDALGNWTSQLRITDPSVPIDAYATRVAVSPDGTLKMVGWIDHYHGTAQVAQLNGTAWNTSTIGRGTAFASFQEVMGLDVGSGRVARAIWKNTAKGGTRTMAASYNK